MRSRVGCIRFFRCAAFELALMATMAINANASAADSISSTVSAIVIAPVNVSDTRFDILHQRSCQRRDG